MGVTRFALLLIGTLAVPACMGSRVVYETKSEFNLIQVIERGGVRYLVFDGGATQSSMNLSDTSELVLPYTRAFVSALAFAPEPSRVLVVGLGGGTIPKFLRRVLPDLAIDVVEIDPAVVDVARRFFGFREDRLMKVYVGDGRRFVEAAKDRYDIIFLDAYGADSIPFALTTREFLRACRAALSPGGIVAANVWSSSANRLYDSMLMTYADAFADVRVVRPPEGGNRIFIAFPAKAKAGRSSVAAAARAFVSAHRLSFDLAATVERGYEVPGAPPAGARVLVDADAPK